MTNNKKVKLSDVYLDHFKGFHKALKEDKYTFYILKGGRNSAKSTHIAFEIVLNIINNPISFIVAKRYNNSVSKTVLPQLKWAINKLGVSEYFSENKSAQILTYKPRGNKIYFIGADDTERVKGIKDEEFEIAGIWVDELPQFKNEDEIDELKNSIIRAKLEDGIKYKMIYSYNPPKRKHNWVNKKFESAMIPDHYYINHSSYLNNKHVADEFIIEAEEVKRVNPRKYDHQYLGLPIGSGIVPFDNLVFRGITDSEIKYFDNIKMGIDWGYGVDPVHFGRMHYDKTRRKLFIFGEIHEVKMSNRKLAEIIIKNGWNDFTIIADSAEPKSIEEMKDHGIRRIVGANKAAGSVEYGEKWLDDLEEIIIDPKRCPNTAREFENIDYEVDKDGNPKDRLNSKDNHSIDETRYALEGEMQRKKSGMGIDLQAWKK
jgi:PBSX family phage terminase large subunit